MRGPLRAVGRRCSAGAEPPNPPAPSPGPTGARRLAGRSRLTGNSVHASPWDPDRDLAPQEPHQNLHSIRGRRGALDDAGEAVDLTVHHTNSLAGPEAIPQTPGPVDRCHPHGEVVDDLVGQGRDRAVEPYPAQDPGELVYAWPAALVLGATKEQIAGEEWNVRMTRTWLRTLDSREEHLEAFFLESGRRDVLRLRLRSDDVPTEHWGGEATGHHSVFSSLTASPTRIDPGANVTILEAGTPASTSSAHLASDSAGRATITWE